jgi:hypothetical protein
MENAYISLLSGLVGAIIGAASSIGAVWVQSRMQNKRERIKHAADFAMEDFKMALSQANASKSKCSISPAFLYLHYHVGLMKLIEDDNVNAESLKKLGDSNDAILKMLKSEDKLRRSAK